MKNLKSIILATSLIVSSNQCQALFYAPTEHKETEKQNINSVYAEEHTHVLDCEYIWNSSSKSGSAIRMLQTNKHFMEQCSDYNGRILMF